jgi:hypothetical protein
VCFSSGSSAARSSASSPSVAVGVVERRLERRRAHVAVEDARIRMVEDRGLDAALEEHRRLAHEVLVESVLARDQYREAVPATTCASPLLAEGRDGSRKADGDAQSSRPMSMPELERVGCRDAEQLALDQPPLDLAPLRRRIPARYGAQPLSRRAVDPIDGELVDQLGRLAALGEADGAQAARREGLPSVAMPRRGGLRAGPSSASSSSGSRGDRPLRRAARRRGRRPSASTPPSAAASSRGSRSSRREQQLRLAP